MSSVVHDHDQDRLHSEEPHTHSSNAIPVHKIFFYAATGILIAGLIGAIVIYVLAVDDGNADPNAYIANRSLYEFQIQRIGGMSAVYFARFNEWLSSLWHGRQLAYTVGLLTLAISFACFWIGDLIAPSEQDDDSKDAA